jgi:hypothetical protein
VSVTERASRGACNARQPSERKRIHLGEAGDALRRSIERLGRAVSDADLRIAARAQVDVREYAPLANAFVAFVPTPEGYRLVACGGAPPQVGERLDLPVFDCELVVTRVGASPLPLDERPCVYLA